MKGVVSWFSWVFIIQSLAGCAINHEQKACISACQNQFIQCNKHCTNNCHDCIKCSDLSAIKYFQHYKNEQCVRGGMIARELKSYQDPLKCRKITCNCLADYRVCTQSCTGVIHKRLQVPPTCC